MEVIEEPEIAEILRLPIELLLKIIESVTHRRDISLVCRKFYEIVCIVERNVFKVSIKDEKTLQDTPLFSSIMNSRREFNSLKIVITTKMTPLCWDRLVTLFTHSHVVSLKIISFDPRREAYIAILWALMKISSNTIHELSFSNICLDYYEDFFKKQNSIKQLSITGSVGDSTFLSNLRLRSLKLIGPKSRHLNEIIKNQSELRVLKIAPDNESNFNNEVFNSITNLGNLETLDIPMNVNLSPELICQLTRIKQLTRLSVSCSQNCFQQLISLSIPTLKDLDVTFEEPAAINSIQILGLTCPNLVNIKFRGPLAVNFLRDFAINFRNMERLEVVNEESYFVNILNFNPVEEFKAKLLHLSLVNHDRKVVTCANDLMRFIKLFPSIQTLVLSKFIEIHLFNFETLLKHLPKLREIVIDSKSFDSTTKVMNLIFSLGSNLKYVKLENFKPQFDNESLKVYFNEKFPVIEKKDGNLILRQMERSFLSWNE